MVRPLLVSRCGLPAMTIAVIWIKLVYINVRLSTVWWEADRSLGEWFRPGYFAHGVSMSPEMISSALGAVLIFVAPLFCLPRTWLYPCLLLLDGVLTSLGLADLLHVRFHGDVISSSQLVISPALLEGLRDGLHTLSPSDIVCYLDVLAGLLLAPLYVRLSRRLSLPPKRFARWWSLGAAGVGLILVLPSLPLMSRLSGGLVQDTAPRIDAAFTLGLLPYHVVDASLHVSGERSSVTEADRERAARFLGAIGETRHRPHGAAGYAAGRNVIVVSAESLQAFPLGLKIAGKPVAPNLTAFAEQSWHFVNFHDQTYLGTTSDAEFLAMHSLHPLASGVLSTRFNNNSYRGLPQILADQGYATLSACAAPRGFWDMDKMHRALGFQQSLFEDSYRMTERIGPWLSDRQFFAQTLPRLAELKRPFMAFLLTGSNHHPYRVPAPEQAERFPSIEGTELGRYVSSVNYFDRAFGEFVEGLRRQGLLDTSVIVVYGDHHAFLEDEKALAALLDFSPTDRFAMLRARKSVPLLIRLPEGALAGRRHVAGGHIDIAPTILSLLGIRTETVILGNDLTQGSDSLVVFRDGSFTDGTHYYFRRSTVGRRDVCYEAATGSRVSCAALEGQRRRAEQRLEISDVIIRGNLVPRLAPAAPL